MAEVVMASYRTALIDHDQDAVKVGLINAMAAERAAPALIPLSERPADEALRAARTVVADAYTEAMRTFRVPLDVQTRVEDQVFADTQVSIEARARTLPLDSRFGPLLERCRRTRSEESGAGSGSP
ncbi:hypothetical protein EBO15_23925 [Actinomadura harenae]|uniref:Uncharacterized protein n=2 Tax=Actinomadura harenae TaxID=2483351 RepID=A0A3M2M260_9ACTN|nr:hypothetical protein EBO15_23925 [Actinomadura harenae]